MTVADYLGRSKEFSTLLKAIEASGSTNVLKSNGFTLFAPNNIAVEKLGDKQLNVLLRPKNKEKLLSIIKDHIHSSVLRMSSAVDRSGKDNSVTSMDNHTLVIRNAGGLFVNNSKVIKADIQCSNGVIHVIDTVILPTPTATINSTPVTGLTPIQSSSEASAERVVSPKNVKAIVLKDNYTRYVTPSYSVEIPTGWEMSDESYFGQRKVKPNKAGGEIGLMTAPPSNQSWDQVYRTSLYFIMREGSGKATPYRLGKTASGIDTASFEVVDEEGFPSRRYVLMKNSDGRLLALSVRVPDRTKDKEWTSHFERLCKTAQFLSPK